MSLKRLPFHPILLTLYPVVHVYSLNTDLVPLRDFARTSLLLMLAGATLLLLILLWVRNLPKAGLILSLQAAVFFTYIPVRDAVRSANIPLPSGGVGLIWFGAMIILTLIITRQSEARIQSLTLRANVVSLILIVMPTQRVLTTVARSHGPATAASHFYSPRQNIGQTRGLPDIYYVVLDMYADSGTLQKHYQHDNGPFLDALRRKGFVIPSGPRSNYTMTFLSLASSLNMRYLEGVAPRVETDRSIPYALIKDNEVTRLLRRLGYRFINFTSRWGPTDTNHLADRNLCRGLSEFSTMMAQTTLLRLVIEAPASVMGWDDRSRVLCTLNTLPRVHDQVTGPRFVFAHILLPHPPYIFTASGAPSTYEQASAKSDRVTDKTGYLEQLKFLNARLEAITDEILRLPGPKPILVLQGDHGPSSLAADPGVWKHPTTEFLLERMGIFSAIFAPQVEPAVFDQHTPVNTFRIIFDKYFDTDFGLIEDRSYFSNYEEPYNFADVTGALTR